MDVTMKFRLPEDVEQLEYAQRGHDYYMALKDIAEECFSIHDGPWDEKLKALAESDKVLDLIESKFFGILNGWKISL